MSEPGTWGGWGAGSAQYRKPQRAKTGEGAGEQVEFAQGTPQIASSGRVVWDRARIDFERIPRTATERALYRFERSLPEFVWNAAALEGNTFTLPQVQTLLDGVSVGGKRVEEVDQVLALRAGIGTMVEQVREGAFELTKAVTDRVHALVAQHEAIESGAFRGEGVVDGGGAVQLAGGGSIGGDPIGEDRAQLISDFYNLGAALALISDPRERALAYFCSATRSQFYFFGYKRTPRIMMVGELMRHGYESVSVPYARQLEFNEALDIMFRTDDATELMVFLTSCATR